MDARSPADSSYWLRPRDAICDVIDDLMGTYRDAAPDMTLEEFIALCEPLGGYIEVHPHCGGMNSCRGFSYDRTIGILTEHSCAGLNTCTGWSCIIP